MIITISGGAASGKSTTAEAVAKKLLLKHYSVGDFMRSIADKKGMTLLELSKEAEKSDKIDKLLDEKQVELGKKEDNFIIDSRLGWHFIPDSIKVLLTVDIKVAAKRIMGQKRKAEDVGFSEKDAVKKIKQREASEKKRYNEYYDVDPYDEKNYDLVIDTTGKTIEETADIIVTFAKTLKKN